MKSASTATLAILAGRKYLRADLYDLTLATGQVYHFTSFQAPLTASIYSPAAGPFAYGTGLVIKRDTITQSTGMNAGSMKLTISPKLNSPSAPVLINGYPFLQACRNGFFDGATIQLSKLFMNRPTPGVQLDTSPGAVGWFRGSIQDVQCGRQTAEFTCDDWLALLGVQQMPRQLYGAGCWHQVYDAGCTLLKSAFTVTGTVAASPTDGAHFNSSLTAADDYYDLGVITMTGNVTPLLAGLSANVSTFKHTSGALVLRFPFPVTPAVGDTFTIYPGCDLQQLTGCTKLGNLAHFGGQPYGPTPETVLDGGAAAPAAQTRGAQAGQLIGTTVSAAQTTGQYRA